MHSNNINDFLSCDNAKLGTCLLVDPANHLINTLFFSLLVGYVPFTNHVHIIAKKKTSEAVFSPGSDWLRLLDSNQRHPR